MGQCLAQNVSQADIPYTVRSMELQVMRLCMFSMDL